MFFHAHTAGRCRRHALAAALIWMAAAAGGQAAANDTLTDAADAAAATDAGVRYEAIPAEDGGVRVSARFRNFDGQPLAVRFDLEASAGAASLAEFGIRNDELDALEQDCRRAARCDQAAFDGYTRRYYLDHALRIVPDPQRGSRLSVDVAAVVARNRLRVAPVAQALQQLAADRGADRDWTWRTAVTLVQRALPYRRPPAQSGGRTVLGFYPPPLALERGYGDCDTKSALLAAILQNLGAADVVGLRLPGHYLLGLERSPEAEQAYITHAGRPYVLVEAAGPAVRAPGQVSDRTRAALDTRQGLRVDPLI